METPSPPAFFSLIPLYIFENCRVFIIFLGRVWKEKKKRKTENLDVRNILAGSHSKHRWRCFTRGDSPRESWTKVDVQYSQKMLFRHNRRRWWSRQNGRGCSQRFCLSFFISIPTIAAYVCCILCGFRREWESWKLSDSCELGGKNQNIRHQGRSSIPWIWRVGIAPSKQGCARELWGSSFWSLGVVGGFATILLQL